VFPVTDRDDLVSRIRYFVDNPAARREAGRICRGYVEEKRGATQIVLDGLARFLSARPEDRPREVSQPPG